MTEAHLEHYVTEHCQNIEAWVIWDMSEWVRDFLKCCEVFWVRSYDRDFFEKNPSRSFQRNILGRFFVENAHSNGWIQKDSNLNYISILYQMQCRHSMDRFTAIMMQVTSLVPLRFDFELGWAPPTAARLLWAHHFYFADRSGLQVFSVDSWKCIVARAVVLLVVKPSNYAGIE